jgi:hypothetical protein
VFCSPHQELVLENPRVPLAPNGAASPPVRMPLTCLSGLRDLELLQIDRIDCPECQPFLDMPGAQLLARCWTALSNLDLFNLGPGELPTAALAELSRMVSLRSLSINSNEQPIAQVGRREGGGQEGKPCGSETAGGSGQLYWTTGHS